MILKDDIYYIGVNDTVIDLFESLYAVPKGMTYNSYIILDEKIAVFDSVDEEFVKDWLAAAEKIIGDRKPDYLIVQHAEPDHSAGVAAFLERYPETELVASERAFPMLEQFFDKEKIQKRVVVTDGDSLSLGKHILQFIMAPFVHWPEVMVTYDAFSHVLFSADAFGTFGSFQEDEHWEEEASRYYFGIVGKFGLSVDKLLKKLEKYHIKMICPLHGPVLKEPLNSYLHFYRTWANYVPEKKEVFIAYSSVYGNTEKAVHYLQGKLRSLGEENVRLMDLSRCDRTKAVAEAFRCDCLVLAATTYNGAVFPSMRNFLWDLAERNFQRRTVAVVENGTWAPNAGNAMKRILEQSRELEFLQTPVKIHSVVSEEAKRQLDALAEEIRKR